MTDNFEANLRSELAGQDPGPVPARLVARIAAERETDAGRRRIRPWATWLASGIATVAVAGALLIVVGSLSVRPTPVGPGASALPSPAVNEPLRPGEGTTSGEFVPFAQVVVGALAFVALAWLALRATSRGVTIGAAVGAVAVIWMFLNLGTSDALEHETGVSGVWPGTIDSSTGDTFITVNGDGPFTIMFTVTNVSRLPLTLEGLLPTQVPPGHDPPIAPRLVALGRFHEPYGTEDIDPFVPMLLPPGASVDLGVLGYAGSCALASPSSVEGAGFTSIDSFLVVYNQLTVRHTQTIALSDPIHIWEPDSCP